MANTNNFEHRDERDLYTERVPRTISGEAVSGQKDSKSGSQEAKEGIGVPGRS